MNETRNKNASKEGRLRIMSIGSWNMAQNVFLSHFPFYRAHAHIHSILDNTITGRKGSRGLIFSVFEILNIFINVDIHLYIHIFCYPCSLCAPNICIVCLLVLQDKVKQTCLFVLRIQKAFLHKPYLYKGI